MITIPNDEQLRDFKNTSGSTNPEEINRYFEEIAKDIINEINLLYELKGNSYIISYEDHMIKKDGNKYHIFIRMEYAVPLKDYIDKNNFSEKDIVRLGIDIASALSLCHKKGIIHRDIKEENLFVSNTDGNFKLGDFSVSKEILNSTSAKTRVGTMNYVCPEIIKGEKYSKNADIYSLGIVLYHFLNNGRSPFLPLDMITPKDVENAYLMRIRGEKMSRPVYGSESSIK